jgi:hypothetical protein
LTTARRSPRSEPPRRAPSPRAVAYDAGVFRSGAHATVAFVALAAAVYATASLTGGWLGVPPWWEEWVAIPEGGALPDGFPKGRWRRRTSPYAQVFELPRPREGREVLSATFAAIGLVTFAVLAASGKRKHSGSTLP